MQAYKKEVQKGGPEQHKDYSPIIGHRFVSKWGPTHKLLNESGKHPTGKTHHR
jgi:hypothetical protein